MQLELLNEQGQPAAKVEAPDTVFGRDYNEALVHQIVVAYQANARQGTRAQKDRATVKHSTKKPWRQKGTGRARHGSIRSPLWRGGGVVFGPHPRKYTQRMPRKMRRLAIRSVLSAKMKADQVVVVEGLTELEPRTKAMIQTLARLPKGDARSTLILVDQPRENLRRGANNLEHVRVLPAQYVNMRDVLKYERLLLTREAVDVIHRLWAQ